MASKLEEAFRAKMGFPSFGALSPRDRRAFMHWQYAYEAICAWVREENKKALDEKRVPCALNLDDFGAEVKDENT